MLFFLACFTNTHPSIPPHIEDNIYKIQQHVQRVEDLSNQLLLAQEKKDTDAVQSIVQELDNENTLLQKQRSIFQENLKVNGEKLIR